MADGQRVAAATCADANAAATASIVADAAAQEWLASTGLPARLVSRDGDVRYAGGWRMPTVAASALHPAATSTAGQDRQDCDKRGRRRGARRACGLFACQRG